jgi:excisionase family DNA binding protein
MSKNKKDAAAYLGISTRQLENYARQGRLSVRKEKGKTGDIAIYDDEELQQLKDEREREHGVIRAAVVREGTSTSGGTNGAGAPSESRAMVRASISEVSQLAPHEFIDQLADAILARQSEQKKQKHEPTITEIAAKPLLTRAEAQRYTGMSRKLLHEAVMSGKVKEVKLGRAYRMKKAELDKYIENL